MIRHPIFLAVMLVLGMAGLAPANAAEAAEVAGSVLALSGDCSVAAGATRRALKPGDAVHVGDTVRVATGARLKLRMIDGSVLSAAAGTTVTIEAYGVDEAAHRRDARLSLAGGLVRALVSGMTAPSRFEIDTATAVAAVRSTDWFVESKPARTRVGVLEGVVALTARSSGKSVEIAKRFGASVVPGHDPTEPKAWTQKEFDEYIAATTLP